VWGRAIRLKKLEEEKVKEKNEKYIK